MKTRKQIDEARAIMRRRMVTPGLTDLQKSMVLGVSNALQWAAGAGNNTIDRMLSDEPMAAGKDGSRVMERLSQLPNALRCAQLLIDVHERRPGWEAAVAQFAAEHLRK